MESHRSFWSISSWRWVLLFCFMPGSWVLQQLREILNRESTSEWLLIFICFIIKLGKLCCVTIFCFRLWVSFQTCGSKIGWTRIRSEISKQLEVATFGSRLAITNQDQVFNINHILSNYCRFYYSFIRLRLDTRPGLNSTLSGTAGLFASGPKHRTMCIGALVAAIKFADCGPSKAWIIRHVAPEISCKQNETRAILQFSSHFFFFGWWFQIPQGLAKQPETSRCTIPKKVHSPATGPT